MKNKACRPKKRRVIIVILSIFIIIFMGIFLFLKLNPVFGGTPDKADKADYTERAANYIDGKFQYPSEYAEEGLSEDKRISEKGEKPVDELPYGNTSFKENPPIYKIYVTWLGHSSLFIQMHGINILIDPIFSDRASPLSSIGPRRFSAPPIEIDELPEIDLVIISHDHYDHLDMDTVKELDAKTKCFTVPLGVENHLERWGIDSNKIQNMAWWEEIDINGLMVACAPVKHLSGRSVNDIRNTLAASWILKDEYHTIYESGDSGFGAHFKAIHDKYGDFDLVMTDCAQYNIKWHSSHMFPEEAADACEILGAKLAMPIHWGAYTLSTHGWDDPPTRFVKKADELGIPTVTPKIGDTFEASDYKSYQDHWWENIK